MKNLFCVMATVTLGIASSTAAAQVKDFPSRPIRIVVPVPPGGSVDTVARLIAQKMSETVGQTVLIDNRPGASTNIGTELVARAAGDGYTLLANTIAFVANPSLFPKIQFDPVKDFAPVSLVATTPNIIAAHPSVPARTVKDLIALAKAKPGNIKYSSAGAGTITHLAPELFKYLTGIKMVHVPYKGGGPALIAVIGGECDVSFLTVVAASGQVHAGKLRALAITSAKRLPVLPEVPTAVESGVPYEFSSWVGILAPASISPDLVRILHEHVVRSARAPDVSERLVKDGAEVVASSPEQFGKTIAAEVRQWAKVIKQAGIGAD